MKILVISDTHGADDQLAEIIKENFDAESIIFLGDGEGDLEYALLKCDIYPYGHHYKNVYQVRGNFDGFSDKPIYLTADFGGFRIFITHGHAYNVRYGTNMLARAAKDHGCSVALYGHTHTRHYSKSMSVEIFNPGSLKLGSYGIIDINGNNIEFQYKDVAESFLKNIS